MFGFYCRMLLVLALLFLYFGCNRANSETNVREATHADDSWYPSKASELSKTVDAYLEARRRRLAAPTPGDPVMTQARNP